MKTFLSVLVSLIVVGTSLGSGASGGVRSISDIPSISPRVLQRSISPKFYKSLLISPIEGCVIVRGQLSGTRLTGIRIVHSELNGAYDALALERAQAITISGYYSLDKISPTASVVMHLLIYRIADGTMALSFARLDEAGGDQQQYYGSAVLAVLKSDGKWDEIKSVDSLQGKGIVLRSPKSDKTVLREIYFFASIGGSKGR
jgi:hypothetical protein